MQNHPPQNDNFRAIHLFERSKIELERIDKIILQGRRISSFASIFHLPSLPIMAIPAEVIDLLICCASVDPEKGPKLEALISKGLDWNLVIEQGHRHETTGGKVTSFVVQ
jgi:hypothetical protein